MDKKKAEKIFDTLKKEYPDAKIALEFKKPIDLLVATILSAQCTDVRVNIITKDLFKKYKTAKDYAKAKQEVFENEIRTAGFFRNKAKSIIGACKKIVSDFGDKVPDNMEEITKLPGVARKTANVILYNAFGVTSGIAVDTHVLRLSQRIGLSKEKTPEKIEKDLMDLYPKKEWGKLSYLLIDHGRKICQARKPKCEECVISKLCDYYRKVKK